jgi:hypothetical protein
MKLFLAALTIWSLLLFGMSCGSATVQEPDSSATAETVTLTNQKPTGFFTVKPDVIKSAPTMREVPPVASAVILPVTKVVNPNSRAVNVFVYLSRANEKRDEVPQKVEVGSFSLYPADRPGKFTLNTALALRKASDASNDANIKDWKLVLELDQKTKQASSPVEVTITAPIWVLTKG